VCAVGKDAGGISAGFEKKGHQKVVRREKSHNDSKKRCHEEVGRKTMACPEPSHCGGILRREKKGKIIRKGGDSLW